MRILLSTEQIDPDRPIIIYGCGGLSEKLTDQLDRAKKLHLVEAYIDTFNEGSHNGLPVRLAEKTLENWDNSKQLILASSHGDTQRLVECYLAQNYLKYCGDLLSERLDSASEKFSDAIQSRDWMKAATLIDAATGEKKRNYQEILTSELDCDLRSPPYSMNKFEELFRLLTNRDIEPDQANAAIPDLLIYDRIFPSPHCSFALQEFDAYLKAFPNSKAILTGTDLASSGDEFAFQKYKSEYCAREGIDTDRVELIHSGTSFKAKHFYTLFLRGVYSVIDLLENENTPFSFTLYSGGEYGLNWDESDRKLRRVLNSPCFSHVITVEPVTRNYLIEKFKVDPSKIKYLFGPITSVSAIEKLSLKKRRFGFEKDTLDICFVANKHMPNGLDKGWDHFISVAAILSKASDDFKFHVVGGFSEEDVPSELDLPMTFYGHQPDSFFPPFHENMDAILSPCRPFLLAPGAFDGAPNVCTAEAGLCGVAVFVTDQLNQNQECVSGENIEFIDDSPENTAKTLLQYHSAPEKLKLLGESCRKRFREIYSCSSQIAPRINLIREAVSRATT